MNKTIKIILSLLVAGVFLWLTFRNVEFADVWDAARTMSYGWLVPFFIITLLSHVIRAERWRMLFTDEDKMPHRSTLFTGVMFGYLVNIALPRVGEVTRPIYVARQIGESNTKVIGTIVLERLVDVLSMFSIMIFVGIFLISDADILSRLFGIDVTDPSVYTSLLVKLLLLGGAVLVVGVLGFLLVRKYSSDDSKAGRFVNKFRLGAKNFFEGVLSVRKLKNWPLFVFYTAMIWVAYISMTYIPFWMFDMQITYDLSFADAVVLTMVSAVGISIPTPGGVGSYHLLMTYSLFILYGVPEPIGLAFATVAHGATIVLYLIVAPLMLAVEKYLSLKREAQK